LESILARHSQLLELNGEHGSDVTNAREHDCDSLILMIRDEEVLRTIEIMQAIAIEVDDSQNDDAEMAEQRDHETVLSQMQEDILYEENEETSRIVTRYGELYHSGSDSYIYGDPDSDGYDGHELEDVSSGEERNPFQYPCPRLPEFTDDDIHENTDTEDGAEEVIEIVDANARLITMIAKQGEDVKKLIGANTRLVALVVTQRETMARLRARIDRLRAFITQLKAHFNTISPSNLIDSRDYMEESASVLMDTAALLAMEHLYSIWRKDLLRTT
jgi:cell division protein FtsB